MALPVMDAAEAYIGLFCARRDAFSAWNEHPSEGDPGWRPQRSPLTPEIVVHALMKEQPSVSGYLINTDSTSHVLALDFDRDDGLDCAYRVSRACWDGGVAAYVEPSRRGAHLWIVAAAPLPAKVLRSAARYFLHQAGLGRIPDPKRAGCTIADPKIEIRPGQDEIDPTGLGSPLRLPTMPHPKNGTRYRLYNGYGNVKEFPLGQRLAEIVDTVQRTPIGFLVYASMQYVEPIDPRDIPKAYRNPKPPNESIWNDASASDILRDEWGVQNARPGHAVKCPAHPDAHPSLSILSDDKRAICKSPGCDLNNGDRGRGTYELHKMSPVTKAATQ